MLILTAIALVVCASKIGDRYRGGGLFPGMGDVAAYIIAALIGQDFVRQAVLGTMKSLRCFPDFDR